MLRRARARSAGKAATIAASTRMTAAKPAARDHRVAIVPMSNDVGDVDGARAAAIQALTEANRLPYTQNPVLQSTIPQNSYLQTRPFPIPTSAGRASARTDSHAGLNAASRHRVPGSAAGQNVRPRRTAVLPARVIRSVVLQEALHFVDAVGRRRMLLYVCLEPGISN